MRKGALNDRAALKAWVGFGRLCAAVADGRFSHFIEERSIK
nr:MAG TPA: hypothetical protein [Caudoviricetes sp.]